MRNLRFGKRNRPHLMIITGALLMMTAWSYQPDFVDQLQQRLRAYAERRVPTVIHMSMNQPCFVPGDTVYYRMQVMDATTYQPVPGRVVVNVSLLDGTGEPVFRSRVLVTQGFGVNQLPLPAGLAPGRYVLLAYHYGMQPELSQAFRIPLWIEGPRKQQRHHNSTLAFFPEGGNLVAGVLNKVVVTGPPDAEAALRQSNETLSTFTFDKGGYGLFFLTPVSGEVYTVVTADGSAANLPSAVDDGVALFVNVPEFPNPLRVTLQVPPDSQWQRSPLHVVLTRNEVVLHAVRVSLSDKRTAVFHVPIDDAPEGVARLSVLTSAGDVLAERLVYIASPSPRLEITMDRKTVPPRARMPLRVSVRDAGGEAIPANLTVTVFRERNPPANATFPSIRQSLLLFNHLRSNAEDIDNWSVYMGTANLDLFLITRRPAGYLWSDVWEGSGSPSVIPQYLRMSGIAQRANGPLPDSTRITFMLTKSATVYEVYPDRDGTFDTWIPFDFFGEEEVYYRAEHKGRTVNDVQITVDPEPLLSTGRVRTLTLEAENSWFDFRRTLEDINTSYRWYQRERVTGSAPSLGALMEEEVSGADIVVNFDDYFLFPTMAETLREIVPSLQYRKQRGRDVVRLFFEDRRRFAEEEPLYVIDGVLTDNTAYFLSLKPIDVASVRIINSAPKLHMLGAIGTNGIVLVETKIPENASRVPRSGNVFKLLGLNEAPSLHQEEFAARPARVPDLRTNLYWNPRILSDSTGDIVIPVYSSDVPGEYRIRIEGLTIGGEPVFGEETFEVVSPQAH